MSREESWPPRVGEPLPRAADAYAAPEKWDQWILADRGHGREWARVFRVGPTDADRTWRAVADAVVYARVHAVRELSVGVNCEVRTILVIDARSSMVRSIWHYADVNATPRLVTAFPTT